MNLQVAVSLAQRLEIGETAGLTLSESSVINTLCVQKHQLLHNAMGYLLS